MNGLTRKEDSFISVPTILFSIAVAKFAAGDRERTRAGAGDVNAVNEWVLHLLRERNNDESADRLDALLLHDQRLVYPDLRKHVVRRRLDDTVNGDTERALPNTGNGRLRVKQPHLVRAGRYGNLVRQCFFYVV